MVNSQDVNTYRRTDAHAIYHTQTNTQYACEYMHTLTHTHTYTHSKQCLLTDNVSE